MSKNRNRLVNDVMGRGLVFGALVMLVATIASVGIVVATEDILLITINGTYPSFSPDGKKIAYTGLEMRGSYAIMYDIWIIDLDKNKYRRLSEAGGIVIDWAPDGKQIFYLLLTRDGASVWIINSDGSDERKIIEIADFNLFIDQLILSPDGYKVTYSSDNNIYVINSDGSNKKFIFKGIPLSWTSNGKRIIFYTSEDDNSSIWEIYLDTGTQNKLSTFAKQKGISPGISPVVSPDGSKIFYGTSIINIDGSNIRRLNLSGYPSAPRWSPDSRRIAYLISESTQRPSNSSIWIVNSDESGQKKVAELPIWSTCQLAWSKGGKEIMYAPYNYENKTTHIYVINVGKASSLKPLADGEPSTPSEKQTGFFEVVFAIAGLLAVAYLLRRK